MEEINRSFTIKEWSEEDRPREKLQIKGPATLSDAELLAILICSGNRNESAVTLSKRILSEVENNLQELGKLTINDFKRFNGVGTVKAITIIAALEIGRRRRSEEALVRKKITSSHSVFELMQPVIGELPHEEFWIIYLNNSNKVLELSQLSKGGITGTMVDIRLALKNALQLGAVALVLAHNHPSGTLKPSKSDLDLTKKLKRGGENLDIKVLDHLIIAENAYFSFADSSLL